MRSALYSLSSRHIWLSPRALNFASRKESLTQGVVFLDLDGTLWPDNGPGGILEIPNFSTFLDANYSILGNDCGKRKIVFVTNQTLFARSSTHSLNRLLTYTLRIIQLMTFFRSIAFLVCHHHPSAKNSRLRRACVYRKPSSLPLDRLYSFFPYSKKKSILVGDRITDVLSGELSQIGKSILIYNAKMFELNDSVHNLEGSYSFFSVIPNFDLITLEKIRSSDV